MRVWDYWHFDSKRQDQYFYVGFALLASAVNNYVFRETKHELTSAWCVLKLSSANH
jgi:hypothetical protein